jgi:hypothetical protein
VATFDVDVGGVTYEVDAPDERTAWKWANATHANHVAPKPAAPKPAPTHAEEIAGSPVTRFAMGAASPAVGIAQIADEGMKRVLPESVYRALRPELARSHEATAPLVKAGREARGSEGFDWAGMAGSVMSPAALAAMKIPLAATRPQKAAQGAKIGGLFGLGAPVEPGEEFLPTKARQVVTGAAFGGAVPPAISAAASGARAVRNVLDPWLPGGVDRVVARTANTAAGDKRDAVIQALTANRQIVPGSQGHAGEVAAPAGSAEFSGLARIASRMKPTAFDDMARGNDAARLTALRTVAQDKPALEAAEAARGAAAGKSYGAAYQQSVKADPELAAMSSNPYFKDALPDALKLAEAKGIDPKANLTEFLHFVKVSLDKQLMKSGDSALGNTEKATVQKLQKQLVDWMGRKNPAYETARREFASASKPINQMQVGQYLENKLVPAINEQGAEAGQRAGMYAEAVRNAPTTLKRATGQPRYQDISEVLTPPQTQTVKTVGEDLGRSAEFERLAKLGSPEAMRIIGASVPELPASGMFNPKYSVARAIVNRITGKVTDKSLNRMAEAMQNPREMARIMQNATPPERAALIEALMQQGGRLATLGVAQQ